MAFAHSVDQGLLGLIPAESLAWLWGSRISEQLRTQGSQVLGHEHAQSQGWGLSVLCSAGFLGYFHYYVQELL